MAISVITEPLPFDELASLISAQEFEGLLVAGVHDPDPLIWIRKLRGLHPGRILPVAILHSPDELTNSAVAMASSRLRIAAVPQRGSVAADRKVVVIDQPGRRLRVGDQRLKCSPIEFRLLLFLMRHAGIVFSRLELLYRIRASDTRIDPRIIDVLVARLRNKIDTDPADSSHFVAVRQLGYKFDDQSTYFKDALSGAPFEAWPSVAD